MNETFSIGDVARRTGMRPSTIRYYEACGLVEPDGRVAGKRVFGQKAIERLSLIAHAKRLGFSLGEVRDLLDGFTKERWSKLAAQKLAALDSMVQKIEMMRGALETISRCRCSDADTCAHAIATKCAPSS